MSHHFDQPQPNPIPTLPIRDVNEFLERTEPEKEPDHAPARETMNVEPAKKNRAGKREIAKRLREVEHFLIEGVTTASIAQYALQMWGVKRRMVQLYIQRIKKLWAEAAAKRDYLAHLELSYQRREKLLAQTLQRTLHCADEKVALQLNRLANQMIKDHDKTMEEIKDHRRRTRRDESPDSQVARLKRADMLVMPLDDFYIRLNNMHHSWQHVWNSEITQRMMKLGISDQAQWAILHDKPAPDYCI